MQSGTTSQMRLHVRSGPYRGRESAIGEGPSIVGSELESDVVLFLKSLQPKHFSIEADPEKTLIEALEGEIHLISGEVLKPGDGCTLHTPASFKAADTEFECCAVVAEDADADKVPPTWRQVVQGAITEHLPVIAPALLVFMLAGLAAVFANQAIREVIAQSDASLAGATTVPPLSAARARVSRNASLEDASGKISNSLQASGIDTVRMDVRDEAIVATGTITEDQRSTWTSIRRDADTELPGNTSFLSEVRVVEAKKAKLPELEAVWFGEEPYVLVDGRRYYPGDFISRAWRVQEIAGRNVIFEADGVPKIVRVR